MLECCSTTMSVDVSTLITMVDTGIIPACAADMATYAGVMSLKGDCGAPILLSQSMQAAKAAQSARKAMPHSQVQAAYAVFGLGA